MADVTRTNRPLSPFMIGQVYRPQVTSVMSILHRLSGIVLCLPSVLVVWWFLAAGGDAGNFDFVDGILTSWFGGLVLLGSLVVFWYHFCNGIRHLFWDAGYALELPVLDKTAIAVVAATAVLTVITLIAAF